MTRAVVITGSEGGIGTALCRAFREAGYRTIGLDVSGSGKCCDAFVEVDLERLCHDATFREVIRNRIIGAVEGAEIGALVNNAAVQILGDTTELSVDQWRKTLDVNLLAPFLLIQLLLPQLESAGGSVVNIASIHATLTKPGFVSYATSKAALVGLTRSMAVDLGSRLRVNAICPAAIATSMLIDSFSENPAAIKALGSLHPAGRIGNPEEVANAAVFLASPAAGFLSGATLEVDGAIGGRLHDPD